MVAAVSALALIILAEPEMSFAQDGINSQRISENTRRPWRMIGTGLGRSDVVAWNPVVYEGRCVEVLGDDLRAARESVASTHSRHYYRSAVMRLVS